MQADREKLRENRRGVCVCVCGGGGGGVPEVGGLKY